MHRASLLSQAAQELSKAEVNYHSKTECKSLRSLIYYETGDIAEADNIKKELLARDSFSITYRVNLARHYIKIKDFENAKEQLSILQRYSPAYAEFHAVYIIYFLEKGEYEEAKKECYELLKLEPGNSLATQTLEKLK